MDACNELNKSSFIWYSPIELNRIPCIFWMRNFVWIAVAYSNVHTCMSLSTYFNYQPVSLKFVSKQIIKHRDFVIRWSVVDINIFILWKWYYPLIAYKPKLFGISFQNKNFSGVVSKLLVGRVARLKTYNILKHVLRCKEILVF